MMKVKSIVPYFGGKRTLAPVIVTELGKHSQYFEPFCGSMTVLFAKPPSQKETVNDLHGDLINLAAIVASPTFGPMLYDNLQRVLFSEGLLKEANAYIEGTPPPSPDSDPWVRRRRAYWYFLASWMGRNGTAGTRRVDYQIAVRWSKDGGSSTGRFKNVLESLPAWHRRLQNVVILNRDAFRILDRFEDCPATAIYVDPPYEASTRSGWRPGKGSDHKYLHEFCHEETLIEKDDHVRLAEVLCQYKHARVVVSYYDCPKIRSLYPGWTIVHHTMNKQLSTTNGVKQAPEILLINGPSNQERTP